MPPKRKRGGAGGRGRRKKRGPGRRKLSDAGNSDGSEDGFHDDPLISGKWTFSVTAKVEELKFNFPELIEEINGADLNMKYVAQSGLQKPLFIEKSDGLDLKMPKSSSKFGVDDVRRHVGGDRLVEVVEVATQKSRQMTVRDFVKYYKTPFEKRKELLNVLSLEFSLTKLENYVRAPGIVKQFDWVERLWPKVLKGGSVAQQQTKAYFPKVQNYCLMSVQGCYTDFHVDFGGTSVWYHVFRGEKIFWMIPPTETNFKLYHAWTMSGSHQDHVFFGDVPEKCHRVHLKAGNTFFVPAGWIHAVYTPVDSLVFGGNFLHSYAIPTQLRVYDLEHSTHVGMKYRYPFFTTMMWYVAADFVKRLCGREYCEEELDGDSGVPKLDESVKKELGEMDPSKEESTQLPTQELHNQPPALSEWNVEAIMNLSRPWEVSGVKELASWLSKLPKNKRQIPYEISEPDCLIRDLGLAAHNIDLCLTGDFPVVGVQEVENQESQTQEMEGRSSDAMDRTIESVISAVGAPSPKKSVSPPPPLSVEPPVKKEKREGVESEEGTTSGTVAGGAWSGFDPLSSVVPLGHKPLPTALRRTPGAAVKRPNTLRDKKQQETSPQEKSFDFATLAFSEQEAGLKSILKPKMPTGNDLDRKSLPGNLHAAPPANNSSVHTHVMAHLTPKVAGGGVSTSSGHASHPELMVRPPVFTPKMQRKTLPPVSVKAPIVPLDPPIPLEIISPGGSGGKNTVSALSPDEARVLEELAKIESEFTGKKAEEKKELPEQTETGEPVSVFNSEEKRFFTEIEALTEVMRSNC